MGEKQRHGRKAGGLLVLSMLGLAIMGFSASANATNDGTTYVELGDLTYASGAGNYNALTEYATVTDYEKALSAGTLADVYVTDFLYDGVEAVKTPDLDDFIESGSNDTKIKTLEIKVINVNTTGNVEFSGEATGVMIGVDTNDLVGEVNLVLNNAMIDTDSKKAPAIYVYNKDRNDTDCKVTIKTKTGTKNYLEGGKLKKVSLLDKNNLNTYSNNYSGENLTNYNSYSNYYGIYTSAEIGEILFATVTADNEDLQDGDPLYFYKGSGAVSSDIDLYFEGEGYLEVKSKNKEGVETKGNLTFSGGVGDYAVYAFDDCLNTTTANSTGGTVRNALAINVGSLLAVVDDEGDEGDAIDSNGSLTIDGGAIYAFAHSVSEDAGLDSETGTYINGGTVIATGNMADATTSTQGMIHAELNEQVEAGTLLVVKDRNGEILTAFRTEKTMQTLLYSDADLEYGSYKIYKDGEISGEEINGLYTRIDSYTGGTEIGYREISGLTAEQQSRTNISTVLGIALAIEVGALGLVILFAYLSSRKKA